MPTPDPDDARLVFAAITHSPLCVECVIKETGVTRARVTVILTSMDAAIRVFSHTKLCPGCLATKRVFCRR